MPRKTKLVTLDKGRDAGKQFLITEMDAFRAEKWAQRAMLALTRAGAEIPRDIAQSGMAGLAVAGLQALQGLSFEDVEPLLDEMFSCVQCVPDRKNAAFVRPVILEGEGADIEEVMSLITLRQEVFALHVDFFFNAAASKSTSKDMAPKTKSRGS